MSSTGHTRGHDEPNPKRRRLRKGTFSCWECKNRKRRCEFGPLYSSICVYCQRQGLPCSSQELPEITGQDCAALEQRIEHIEEMVHRVVQQRGNPTREESQQMLSGLRHFDPNLRSGLRAVSHERLSRGSSLTGYLLSVLPAPSVMLVIFNSSKQHDAPLQNIQSSNGWTESLSQGGFLISDIIPTAHPITLAHRLIRLAICLGEINDDTSQRTKLGLEEPISTAARRYYETASRTVMSQDSLVGSLDGLETLMLQSRYHISVGELHTARLIFKRASHIAHTMKLPQQARLLGSRAESIWFQILYSDRFISLMLGQPFSVIDNPSIAQDRTCRNITPQILERIHVEISEQIIVRNLRIQHNRQHIDVRDGDSIQDHKETKRLDYDLKKAARALPSTWWISPIVEDAESDGRAMEKTAKLLLQMHHYYLLVLIHQPYLLEVVRWTSSQIELHSLDQAYSKMAIVSASREILSRYLLLRKIHRSPSYRGFDDKAFTAGVALLLTHLDGHRLGSANVLEHQRPQDLGILDSVIGCIEVLSCRNRDSQGSYRAKLLRRFIQIEANAAEGNNHTVCNDEALDENQKSHSTEEGCDLKFDIPYFGTIHIIRHTSARSNFNDIPSMNPISDTAPELFLSDTLSMESPE